MVVRLILTVVVWCSLGLIKIIEIKSVVNYSEVLKKKDKIIEWAKGHVSYHMHLFMFNYERLIVSH